MSNYYSNGQVAQYELELSRDAVYAWGAGALADAEENHYHEFIYRFKATIEIGTNEEVIIALEPIFPDD